MMTSYRIRRGPPECRETASCGHYFEAGSRFCPDPAGQGNRLFFVLKYAGEISKKILYHGIGKMQDAMKKKPFSSFGDLHSLFFVVKYG
jgi:hypothetical protein